VQLIYFYCKFSLIANIFYTIVGHKKIVKRNDKTISRTSSYKCSSVKLENHFESVLKTTKCKFM